MTILTGLRLQNFGPYRGTFELALQAGCYAVVATREDDPTRSNYQGKTTLLGAIRFLMTGKVDAKVWPTEDSWITRGEPEGGVDGEFDNGVFAIRTRVRGDATRLKVTVPNHDGTERDLHGAPAEEFLQTLAGANPAEQKATWWCGQKEADYFTVADPAKLTELVVGWLGLEKVRTACALAADATKELTARHDALQRDITGWELNTAGVDRPYLEEAVETARAALEREEERAASMRSADAEIVRRSSLERESREYVQAEARLQTLRALPRSGLAVDVDKRAKAAGESLVVLRRAQAEHGEREKLARGEFGGTCPVSGRDCPVTDLINADNDTARRRFAESKDVLTTAEKKHQEARLGEQAARQAAAAHMQMDAEDNQLQRTMAARRPAHEEFQRLGAATPEGKLAIDTRAARDTLVEAARVLKQYDATLACIASHRAVLEALQPELTAHREALVLLGPAGLQRRLARRALDAMEDRANEAFDSCGIDLAVTFEWERPTQQPNDACDVCGLAFPKSAKVKTCSECGAARGPKMEQKLRCVVDPKSGGADDLGGLAGRLGVAAWLRNQRGSSWGVLCLDEPIAALDAYNRTALMRKLQQLAAAAGFEQVFIVAHDRASLDALPNRILITGTPGGSRIEVVA